MWSVYYFKNSFTVYHVIGTVLLFGGSFIYTISSSYNLKKNS